MIELPSSSGIKQNLFGKRFRQRDLVLDAHSLLKWSGEGEQVKDRQFKFKQILTVDCIFGR